MSETRGLTSNDEIADALERISLLLELTEENPFKVRAYRLASEVIREMTDSIADLARAGDNAGLQGITGIGKSISQQIIELVGAGTCSQLESLRRVIPETVLELLRVRGIGIKTAQLLYRDFGISNIEDLKAFAEGGGLQSVQGLGEKAEARIKSQLEDL